MLFSIITINYNNAQGLLKTISSIEKQTFRNFEYIVIDGGSNDKSIDIIKDNHSTVNYWCSEKDNGIYDAQNKGIDKASGEYLVFMNSGDCFTDNYVLEKVADYIDKNKGYKLYYGNTNLVELDGEKRFLAPPQTLDINFFFFATLNHQSCFIHSSLFNVYGNYNILYKLGADYDFFFKVFLKEPQAYLYINELICDYENYGVSANKKHFETIVRERKQIQQTLLNKEQLTLLERLEIQNLGRQSSFFKMVPNSHRLKAVYDRFYFYWYKFRT